MYSYLPFDEVQRIPDLPRHPWKRVIQTGVLFGGNLALLFGIVDWVRSRRQ